MPPRKCCPSPPDQICICASMAQSGLTRRAAAPDARDVRTRARLFMMLPRVCFSTAAERGDGGGTAETPIRFVDGVEPYEPKQPIEVNPSEQIGNLRWLASGWGGGCLGNKYRVVCQGTQVNNGRSELRSKYRGVGKVAVNPHPVHVRVAGPPWPWGGNSISLVDYVDRPQPGHVPGSESPEESDNVPPGSHENRRRCMRIAP